MAGIQSMSVDDFSYDFDEEDVVTSYTDEELNEVDKYDEDR
jgi:hypothetical protein